MNYYPNYYQNYHQYVQQPNQFYQPEPSGLNGKIVDSEEVVRITDVPLGGYGVFPRADMKAIYLKTWNANGTTNVLTFAPIEGAKQEISFEDVLKRLDILEAKIDNLKGGTKNESNAINSNDF